jgi:ABC-2 type transport system ATP-binding protein
MTTAVAINVEGLSKVYEPTPPWMRLLVRSASLVPVTALDDVTFSLAAGEICAVIGPNGAGKSTLFRILTGLTTPSAGTARVLGMDPVTDAHRIRRQVGFMPAEDRTLFLRHTCRENLRFHGRLQGIDESTLKQRIDDVLDLVGLGEAKDRTGFALSSGMRSRLMLARALVHEPKVLILDEPTGAVDPIGAHEFLELIIKITVERGTATLISSHRLEEIDALRDNVLLLDRGRVVMSGHLEEFQRVAAQRVYDVVCADDLAAERVATQLRIMLRHLPRCTGAEGSSATPWANTENFDLQWLPELGGDVEGVSLRHLSLRETISSLLDETGDTS